MGTFGKIDVGGTSWAIPTHSVATKFSLLENCTTTQISLYVSGDNGNFRVGIYGHDTVNNRPDTLLASSGIEACVVNAWHDFAVVTALVTGTYWLAVYCSDAAGVMAINYDAGAVNQMVLKTGSQFPSPWGVPDWQGDRECSEHCDYSTGFISRILKGVGI